MKILDRKIIHSGGSFSITHLDSLISQMHRHSEYELVVIEEGEGTVCMGSTVTRFYKGDVLFYASMLPHSYYCESEVSGKKPSAWIAQFPPIVFPSYTERLPDWAELDELIERSNHGIVFNDPELANFVKTNLINIDSLYGFERFHALFSILVKLCRNTNFRLLMPFPFKDSDEQILDIIVSVNQYIRAKYAEKINLADLASIAGLSETAFCRYYKKHTSITAFEFIARVRIQNAARRLMLTNRTVGEIAYDCGYCQIAQFNKVFKRIMKLSPSAYRQLTRKKAIDE